MRLEIILLVAIAALTFGLLALAVTGPVAVGPASGAFQILYSSKLIIVYAVAHAITGVFLFKGITTNCKYRKPALTVLSCLTLFIGLLVLVASEITTVTWIYPFVMSAVALVAHDLPDKE